MSVRKLRVERGWSQEQLALMSGLSIRTIQRIECGQTPALESLKSLAAVFEVHIQDLTMEKQEMNASENRQPDDPVRTHQQAVKGFYHHALRYVVVITLLFIINWWTAPEYIWAKWPTLGWGIGILSHGLRTFGSRARPASEAADH